MVRRSLTIVGAWSSIAALSLSIHYASGSALAVGAFVILATAFGCTLAAAITSIGRDN